MLRWVSKYFQSSECAKMPPSLFLPYDPSDFLFLKHLLTQIRFFLSLRATFFSSSSNINAIAANRLLENEWGCIFDGNHRRPPITCCSWRWLNTTDSVNTDHSDGTKMERWRNGKVTHSVNRFLLSTVLAWLTWLMKGFFFWLAATPASHSQNSRS